jgi:hypothetical protein
MSPASQITEAMYESNSKRKLELLEELRKAGMKEVYSELFRIDQTPWREYQTRMEAKHASV